MLPPLPRCSGWTSSSLVHPSHISLPRKGRRVGLHIVLFEACSAFTRVAACTLALSPNRDTLSEGFSHFVTSIAARVASGWSACRVGLAPTHMGRFGSRGEIQLRMTNTPVGCFGIQGLSPIARPGRFLARSNSHSVVARSDCTNIPLAAAGLRRTRPFWKAAFEAIVGGGSSTWIRQD